jgi:hypothetical protein
MKKYIVLFGGLLAIAIFIQIMMTASGLKEDDSAETTAKNAFTRSVQQELDRANSDAKESIALLSGGDSTSREEEKTRILASADILIDLFRPDNSYSVEERAKIVYHASLIAELSGFQKENMGDIEQRLMKHPIFIMAEFMRDYAVDGYYGEINQELLERGALNIKQLAENKSTYRASYLELLMEKYE